MMIFVLSVRILIHWNTPSYNALHEILSWFNVSHNTSINLSPELILFQNYIPGPSLVPRRSPLPRCPREVWERAGERTPSQYWQNTPDFSAILPLVTFYEFLQLHFGKTARR